jgi:hypothetical protein
VRHPERCEVNTAHPDEDTGSLLGRRIAYVPCGLPAHWRVEDRYDVCERHCRDALLDGEPVTDLLEYDPVELDDDGEIARAA